MCHTLAYGAVQISKPARRAPASAFLRRRLSDWLYRLDWQPQPLPENAKSEASGPGTWLLLDNGSQCGAEVARQFSIDPESKANGGDMGWVTAASLPSGLQKALVGAKPGLMARPVAAAGGWYVLDVIATRPAQVLSFATVRAGLQAELTRVARSHALDGWLAAARTKASIQQK